MRLLILGTGGMAAQHAKHFAANDGVTLVGGVDVDPNRLAAFNKEHGIENGFASLDAALAWGEFDAIANVTPDSIHHATCRSSPYRFLPLCSRSITWWPSSGFGHFSDQCRAGDSFLLPPHY